MRSLRASNKSVDSSRAAHCILWGGHDGPMVDGRVLGKLESSFPRNRRQVDGGRGEEPRHEVREGALQELFNTGITSEFIDRRNPYVVTRDGSRFLVNISAEDENPAPITVVLNWDARLKK